MRFINGFVIEVPVRLGATVIFLGRSWRCFIKKLTFGLSTPALLLEHDTSKLRIVCKDMDNNCPYCTSA